MASLRIRFAVVRLPTGLVQSESRSLGRAFDGPKSVGEAAMRLVAAVSACFV